VFRKRRHFCLRLAEELPGFLHLVLPEQAHGVIEARGSLNLVLDAKRENRIVTSSLFRDGQGSFGGGVLAVAILSQAESQFVPRQRRAALPQIHSLLSEIEGIR